MIRHGHNPFLAAALLLAALVAGGPVASARADQHAAELDELFVLLAATHNANSARSVEEKIWAAWFKAPDPRAGEMFDRGRAAVEATDLDTAKAVFDQLTRDFPDFAEAWNQRAIVHFLNGDIAGALADVERALALEPRHFGALSGRGECYLRLQRPRDALAAFQQTLTIDPWLDTVRARVEMLREWLSQQPHAI